MRIVFLFPLLIFSSHLISAQNKNLHGADVMYHLSSISNLTIEKYIPEDIKGKVVEGHYIPSLGYNVVINYGRNTSKHLTLFTGLGYSNREMNLKVTVTDYDASGIYPVVVSRNEYDSQLKMHYLRIPAIMKWHTDLDNIFIVFFKLGFQYDLLLNAKLNINSKMYNYTDNLNRNDVSFSFSPGFELNPFERILIMIGLKYDSGFSDIEQKPKFGVTKPTPTVHKEIGIICGINYRW